MVVVMNITVFCVAVVCRLVEVFTSVLEQHNCLSSGLKNQSLTLKMEAEIFSLYMFHDQRKMSSTSLQMPHVSTVDCDTSSNDLKIPGMQALYVVCKLFLVSLKNLVIQTKNGLKVSSSSVVGT
jgi:hypothetical protein